MCYAIPGRVKSIEDKLVRVDYFGEERKAYNEFYFLLPGDYVYAQGGYIVSKIPHAEAVEILDSWKETFFQLQEADIFLSRLPEERRNADRRTVLLMEKRLQGGALSAAEMVYLLGLNDDQAEEFVLKTANFLRQKHLKNSCCVHGIIEISNRCSNGCSYCGISGNNKSLKRYRMTKEDVFLAARDAVERHGFRSLVLQSGEECGYCKTELCEMVRGIREELGALVFVSFGDLGVDVLEALYKAGARGLLMRFESSNPELFAKVCPGKKLSGRLEHIRKGYELGYMIVTGSLIGLPGQRDTDIVNDIMLAGELKAEMLSFGPFIPHPATPLAGENSPSAAKMFKALALARFASSPDAKILVTTAFETMTPCAREKGLLSGANSVMLNVTPLEYRSLYSIYPSRAHETEAIENQVKELVALLGSLGRAPTDLNVNAK